MTNTTFSHQITEDEMNFKTISQVDYAFCYLRRDFVWTTIYYLDFQSYLLPIIKAQPCSLILKALEPKSLWITAINPIVAHILLQKKKTNNFWNKDINLGKLDVVFHQHFICWSIIWNHRTHFICWLSPKKKKEKKRTNSTDACFSIYCT